jgi:hypothetical protein
MSYQPGPIAALPYTIKTSIRIGDITNGRRTLANVCPTEVTCLTLSCRHVQVGN